MIHNGYMSRHGNAVGNNIVIANFTIMGNVSISHDKITVTNRSHIAFAGCPVNGDKLADGILVADVNIGLLTMEFQILAFVAEYGIGKYSVLLTNSCPYIHHGVSANFRTVPDDRLLIDNGSWTDSDIFAQLRLRGDNGRGMNFY